LLGFLLSSTAAKCNVVIRNFIAAKRNVIAAKSYDFSERLLHLHVRSAKIPPLLTNAIPPLPSYSSCNASPYWLSR
jgi:hypothetical protein